MNNLKSGGTLFLAYEGRMGRATNQGKDLVSVRGRSDDGQVVR